MKGTSPHSRTPTHLRKDPLVAFYLSLGRGEQLAGRRQTAEAATRKARLTAALYSLRNRRVP